MPGITQTLAEFVVKTTFDDLPGPAVLRTKQVLLDSIGCALGSYITDRARIAIELTEALGGYPQASIIGQRKTSYALAAFANGELINTLDYDSIGPLCSHVCPGVVAASLSMAERANASGKDLITAIAVGLETGGRVANSLSGQRIPKAEPPYYEAARRYSFSSTIFGPAASAAKLLGFDSQRVANTFGVAGSSTPVPARMKWANTVGPFPMLKYNCWFGWIAQLAATAALVVERGFTADASILDGDYGFWQIYGSAFFHPDVITGGLGKQWHIEEAWFKAYPNDGLAHSFVEGIINLVQENKIKPEDIEAISIKGNHVLVEPNKSLPGVTSFSDTQFLMSYIAAVAAFHGQRPDPNWQMPSTFNDPKLKELMKRVKVALHPRADEIVSERLRTGQNPNFHDAIVEMTVKGKTFSTEVLEPKGFYTRLLSDEELKEKFRNNAAYSLVRSDKVERAIDMIYGLEKVANIKELTALLTTE